MYNDMYIYEGREVIPINDQYSAQNFGKYGPIIKKYEIAVRLWKVMASSCSLQHACILIL